MPFVALKAVEKVTNGSDLLKRVADWRDGEGRSVIEGIDRLQQVLRTMPKAEERKAELAEIEKMLESNFQIVPRIVLAFLQIPRGAFAGVDEAVRTFRSIRSYRWIWQIRNPQLAAAWSDRIRAILR